MPRISQTWRYALIGGLASIPPSIALYWASGMGNEFSLNMVFFGGLLGAWLAKGTTAETDSVGFRAGLIGGLPGLWMAIRFLPEAIAYASPVWLQVAGWILVVGIVSMVLIGVSGIVGLIGGKVGNWFAAKVTERGLAAA